MLFSSLVFLYRFLPLVIISILLSKSTWHNLILLLASLFFYAWGGVSYTLILIGSILINYGMGLWIDRHKEEKRGKWLLALGIGINLLILLLFKYANFLVDNLNVLLLAAGQEVITLKPVKLALGISFFTFQAISYLVDIYVDRAKVQRKIIDLALYIALFPQLIAGPIVRYNTIAAQLQKRSVSIDQIQQGIQRFIIGLAKKVLLANNFALLADDIFALQTDNLSTGVAWMGLLCYTLQIYFDFSGYSDMAIGLGRIFGFTIPENFNFPYIARSIREFWRRWHITLSQWFRDYLYIPLGGNRGSTGRTYFNLLIVFFLTGLWHGAAWNFIFWGLFHGIFMLLERTGWGAILKRIWWPFANLYTLLVVMIGWVFFRANTFEHAWGYVERLFSYTAQVEVPFDLNYYLNGEFVLALMIGVLASTPLFNVLGARLSTAFSQNSRLEVLYYLGSSILLLLLFIWCSINLASSAYNPFIYFRF